MFSLISSFEFVPFISPELLSPHILIMQPTLLVVMGQSTFSYSGESLVIYKSTILEVRGEFNTYSNLFSYAPSLSSLVLKYWELGFFVCLFLFFSFLFFLFSFLLPCLILFCFPSAYGRQRIRDVWCTNLICEQENSRGGRASTEEPAARRPQAVSHWNEMYPLF